MNSIVSINKEEDISKITKETKYINIPIDIVNNNINNYFLINGVDYSYSESINSKQGFIYTDYNMFKQGELLIDSIIKDIPQNLSDIEKVRYIYITLGKELNIDINAKDIEDTFVVNRINKNLKPYYDVYFVIKNYKGIIKINEPNKCQELKWVLLDNMPDDVIEFEKIALDNYEKGIKFSSIRIDEEKDMQRLNK